MELICSRPYLLQWLGAVIPQSHEHHKQMRDRGDIVIRFTQGGPTMFWAWVSEEAKVRRK